ncbi:acyltransferase [Vibrio diabolicus]|uniref:acyltransferase n=1 Tax=Vibrio diabolicus TaxID=50719 RepID=UPI003F86C734
MKLYNRLIRTLGVELKGTPRYISTKVKFDDFSLVSLDDRVVISENVILLTHDYSLTTGLISIGLEPDTDIAFKYGISIGKNVFIGMGSILMPGSVIDDNVIVGAGSVVRGHVPSNSVVLGNPARVVCRLDDKANVWAKRVNQDA